MIVESLIDKITNLCGAVALGAWVYWIWKHKLTSPATKQDNPDNYNNDANKN